VRVVELFAREERFAGLERPAPARDARRTAELAEIESRRTTAMESEQPLGASDNEAQSESESEPITTDAESEASPEAVAPVPASETGSPGGESDASPDATPAPGSASADLPVDENLAKMLAAEQAQRAARAAVPMTPHVEVSPTAGDRVGGVGRRHGRAGGDRFTHRAVCTKITKSAQAVDAPKCAANERGTSAGHRHPRRSEDQQAWERAGH